MKLSGLSVFAVLALCAACASSDTGAKRPAAVESAFSARQFDRARSDARAMAVAERVLACLGGEAAWEGVPYVHWNFFGVRRWLWDKQHGRARVESQAESPESPESPGSSEGGVAQVVVLEPESGTGRAWRGGVALAGEELEQALAKARSQWINDTYWLAMPYKLMDPGVVLAYAGPRSAVDGQDCEVLTLSFDEVGDTPQNRYDVYVESATGLVVQWDYYADAGDDRPTLRSPWSGWMRYGSVLLSGGRGERALTEIAVYDALPAAIFASPEPFDPTAHRARAASALAAAAASGTPTGG